MAPTVQQNLEMHLRENQFPPIKEYTLEIFGWTAQYMRGLWTFIQQRILTNTLKIYNLPGIVENQKYCLTKKIKFRFFMLGLLQMLQMFIGIIH